MFKAYTYIKKVPYEGKIQKNFLSRGIKEVQNFRVSVFSTRISHFNL